MKRLRSLFGIGTVVLALAFLLTGSAYAVTCVGNCGVLGADGAVTLPPTGHTSYTYLSTNGGVNGAGQLASLNLPGVTYTDGSSLKTDNFTANAGSQLQYYFNYVTSDGDIYTDYGWAELFASDGTDIANIYSATTDITPVDPGPGTFYSAGFGGSGSGYSPNTNWSPLGAWSGTCYYVGCGQTGWVQENYTIANAGTYYLVFGVTNARDTLWDTGLAIDGLTIDDDPIPTTPEPSSVLLLGSGMAALVGSLRRKR